MIKTATFKIKVCTEENKNKVLCAIHCPMELLFDSIKKTDELIDMHNKIKENGSSDYLYITASDYYDDNNNYILSDYIFSDISAVVESSSYFEFMKHEKTLGFINLPERFSDED